MFPSTPPEGGRDPRPDGARPGHPGTPRASGAREPVAATGRATTYGAAAAARPAFPAPGDADEVPDPDQDADAPRERPSRRRRGGADPVAREDPDPPGEDEEPAEEDAPAVPVRPTLSAAIAGFAALLGAGLVVGAQTSGPDARLPYAVVVFGVQVLFVLAWTMATRPPALKTVATVAVVVAAVADTAAAATASATLAPLLYVAVTGFLAALLGQTVRRADRARIKESLGATFVIVVGVVAFAVLIVLTRKPIGTQAIVVCLSATGVSLLVARLTDGVFPKPRMAPQVPRGATGVVLGAMLGVLTSAVLGRYIVEFSPTSGAVVGLIAAGVAGLADLAVNYAEAGRQMAGEQPTLWLVRHLQGPLGGFALAAAATYILAVLYLS